jgi:uncharacterized protein (DUF488 family)
LVVYTVGYQGKQAEELPVLLSQAGVTTVLDVRELPLSRRRGLSKTPLSSLLNRAGLDYVHDRRLGNPKQYRDQLKAGGDWDAFAELFRARLNSLSSVLDGVVATIADGEVLCLLCFEADASQCHRSLVAEALAERASGVRVQHL